MKWLPLLILLGTRLSWAIDCSTVKPFRAMDKQKIFVSATRAFWKKVDGQEVQDQEEICQSTSSITAYDIRGREEEAYWCLKPDPKEIVTCDLNFDGGASQLVIIPSVWIRTAGKTDLRGYQFHSYVFKAGDQSMFIHDVFARSQVRSLQPQLVDLDGAYKDGESSYKDGYFVEVAFY